MNTIPSGKNIALIAYAPFVGFFIAFFMNKDEHFQFATWHIKNMFGIFLMFLIATIIQSQIHYLFGDVIWLVAFIFWIFSFIMALSNKTKAIPFLSDKFQEWFTFLD